MSDAEFGTEARYESRLAKISLSEEGKRLIREFDDELELDELTEAGQEAQTAAKTKWTRPEALVGSPDRIKRIARDMRDMRDMLDHFEKREEAIKGKAMIAAMSHRYPPRQGHGCQGRNRLLQAVKARLVKFGGAGRTAAETETVIRRLVGRALVSGDAIDIFDAAGIKKPDISAPPEEFLPAVKNMGI